MAKSNIRTSPDLHPIVTVEDVVAKHVAQISIGSKSSRSEALIIHLPSELKPYPRRGTPSGVWPLTGFLPDRAPRLIAPISVFKCMPLASKVRSITALPIWNVQRHSELSISHIWIVWSSEIASRRESWEKPRARTPFPRRGRIVKQSPVAGRNIRIDQVDPSTDATNVSSCEKATSP